MRSDVIYISAPFDLRGIGEAAIAWEALQLFQPLLGQDAQMAGFAAMAHAEGMTIRVLAAPEIYSDGVSLDELWRQREERILAHIRFGSPRLPRILKGTANAIVFAEDTTIPTNLGRHPFAAGSALPATVETVLVYDETLLVPERIGTGSAPCVVLPPDFARISENTKEREPPGGMILQSCAEYSSTVWHRSAPSSPYGDATEALAGRTAVLLPWNLAAPGSLVPDVLEKVSLLAAQHRFPLTLVVLPYNDVPGSLATIEAVATSCMQHHANHVDGPAILLARTWSISAGLALLQMCRRAWIDATDPEWRWTLQRLGACGLPINFISKTPDKLSALYDPGPFAADELVTRQSHDRAGPLFWRTTVLSLRRLSALAEAVTRGVDAPFWPTVPKRTGQGASPALQELLQLAKSRLDG